MPFDKNIALEHYAKSGGNSLQALQDYCKAVQHKNAYGIAKEIDEIQGALWGIILGTMGTTRFTRQQLEQIVQDYLPGKAPWVDEQGMAALMRWLVWMAWHEDYLRDGPPPAAGA